MLGRLFPCRVNERADRVTGKQNRGVPVVCGFLWGNRLCVFLPPFYFLVASNHLTIPLPPMDLFRFSARRPQTSLPRPVLYYWVVDVSREMVLALVTQLLQPDSPYIPRLWIGVQSASSRQEHGEDSKWIKSQSKKEDPNGYRGSVVTGQEETDYHFPKFLLTGILSLYFWATSHSAQCSGTAQGSLLTFIRGLGNFHLVLEMSLGLPSAH